MPFISSLTVFHGLELHYYMQSSENGHSWLIPSFSRLSTMWAVGYLISVSLSSYGSSPLFLVFLDYEFAYLASIHHRANYINYFFLILCILSVLVLWGPYRPEETLPFFPGLAKFYRQQMAALGTCFLYANQPPPYLTLYAPPELFKVVNPKLFTPALPCLSHRNPKKGSGLSFSLAPVFRHRSKCGDLIWHQVSLVTHSLEPANTVTSSFQALFSFFSNGHGDFTIP